MGARGIIVGALLLAAAYAGKESDLLDAGSRPEPEPPRQSLGVTSSAFDSRFDFASQLLLATATLSPTPPPPTATLEPTETPLPPTETPVPPTETAVPPTDTPVPPTDTPVPPTDTPLPPTETPTPIPPTATPIPPTATPIPPTETPVPPTETPLPDQLVATPGSGQTLFAGELTGHATMYAPSLAGNTLGCNGYGVYDPANQTVVAVGPALYDTFPCGTVLQICGPGGCIVAAREDSCPGCGGADIDMSTAGVTAVCGDGVLECEVTISSPQ